MPRKKTTTVVDPKRARQLRAQARREARKANGGSTRNKDKDPNDLTWVKSISVIMAAARVLNSLKPGDYAYWLSIKHGKKDGNPPVAGYLPCREFRTDDRVYYGFAIMEHRDELHRRWDNSRKELRSNIPNNMLS